MRLGVKKNEGQQSLLDTQVLDTYQHLTYPENLSEIYQRFCIWIVFFRFNIINLNTSGQKDSCVLLERLCKKKIQKLPLSNLFD